MDHSSGWIEIPDRELGEGGQGKVLLVRKKSEFGDDVSFAEVLKKVFITLSRGVIDPKARDEQYSVFRKAIKQINCDEDQKNQAALKVLHTLDNDEDAIRAKKRIGNEIKAMAEIRHSNLLRILDYSLDDYWYVSEYHPNGKLSDNDNISTFNGNGYESLKAIRPLIEGVALLHKKKWVHRDIKPDNIFISTEKKLILGDFGLIYLKDDQQSRISHTFEKVGSRDWMPPWAHGKRVEDVSEAFDVFSIGKVIWSMISGRKYLHHIYFKHDEYNLEKLFSDDSSMIMVNALLKKCIVEFEEDCLPNAEALLKECDRLILYFENGTGLLGDNRERPCKVCNNGMYSKIIDKDNVRIKAFFGYHSGATRDLIICTCNNCGHVQLFHCLGQSDPPAWQK